MRRLTEDEGQTEAGGQTEDEETGRGWGTDRR